MKFQFEAVLKNCFVKDESDAKDMLLLCGYLIRYFEETNHSDYATFKVSCSLYRHKELKLIKNCKFMFYFRI